MSISIRDHSRVGLARRVPAPGPGLTPGTDHPNMPKATAPLHPFANQPQGLARAILAADNGFGQRGCSAAAIDAAIDATEAMHRALVLTEGGAALAAEKIEFLLGVGLLDGNWLEPLLESVLADLRREPNA